MNHRSPTPPQAPALRPSATRRRLLALALGGAALGTLAGCAHQDMGLYASQQPVLDLARYFNGKVLAHGMFQDRSGQVVRRFTVEMDGRWDGDQGVLDERFTYADGTQDRRVWHLTRHPDGRYSGTAADVVGTASGQTSGNAFYWTYTLRLPVDGTTYEVRFDDWMYLIDGRVMLNRATMSKWGVRLGEVTLSFHKLAP